jgi:hypothetical protein
MKDGKRGFLRKWIFEHAEEEWRKKVNNMIFLSYPYEKYGQFKRDEIKKNCDVKNDYKGKELYMVRLIREGKMKIFRVDIIIGYYQI